MLVMHQLGKDPGDDKMRKATLIWILVACGALLFGIAFVAGYADRANARKRAEALAQVSSGVLRPDAAGLVVLPGELSTLSLDGIALVATPRPGQTMMVFTTRRGRGKNFAGYLYTTLPLSTDDITIGENRERWIDFQSQIVFIRSSCGSNCYSVFSDFD